jgi:hypothetical protein
MKLSEKAKSTSFRRKVLIPPVIGIIYITLYVLIHNSEQNYLGDNIFLIVSYVIFALWILIASIVFESYKVNQ